MASTEVSAAEAGHTTQEVTELLKRTIPFEPLAPELLRKVAALAEWEKHHAGDVIYEVGDRAGDLFVVISGRVKHELSPDSEATALIKELEHGDVFGWAAMLKESRRRLANATCVEDCELLRMNGEVLIDVLSDDPDQAREVLARFAKLVTEDFTIPSWLARMVDLPEQGLEAGHATRGLTGLALLRYRAFQWLKSPRPYQMALGFVIVVGFWWLAAEVIGIWRFPQLPGPVESFTEWTSPDPIYGLSLYTPEYYTHIWTSLARIFGAMCIAVGAGVPVGLFLGWSRKFRGYVFPIFETLRPIPILAWVPLAIIMFDQVWSSILFLATLASFYAVGLNTMLGVQSIDESYPRAARCLGATHWQIFRHIIIPGALPFIFTGLQIAVGVAWFSLVAAEMVSGQYGLGYVINNSYTTVRYPTIVIGMITLGILGYITSALVRMVGDYLMQWRVRELALGEDR